MAWKMDINEAESIQVKEEDAMFPQIICNDIKTELFEEEARETVYFIKCEMCKENSDNERECVHKKNDGLSYKEQDDKVQVQSLCSADGLHNNRFKVDVKYEVENTDPSSYQKKDYSIMKISNSEVTVKEEEYFDSPECLSTNIDFIECETGEVKTEVDDIFCENVKSESVKEEPPDHKASLSSGMMAQDENSNEEVQPCSSKESQEDCDTKPYCPKREDEYKEIFRCQVCSRSFSTRAHFAKHKTTHTRGKRFRCKICPKSYSARGDLVRHERTHTGENLFNCKVCSKSFVKRGDLVTHGRTHTGEKPFNCKVCSKSFMTSSSLVVHGRTHTGEKPFICEICTRSFRIGCDLVRHRRTHTGETPFKCKVCYKSFSVNSNLVSHERVHARTKPFNCKVCSKSFPFRSNLVTHERIHAREKAFNCKVCPISFRKRSDLVSHERVHT